MQNDDIHKMSTKSKNRIYNYEWIEAIQYIICLVQGAYNKYIEADC